MKTNRYPSKCNNCQTEMPAGKGILERSGRRWIVWCEPCFNRSDNSSHEDRECGDRAYEDASANACGY
jgi:hypothetical protein